MAMKYIEKVTKETPLVGRVVNTLKSENQEENAPSIKAVLDNLQPKQLLINNDFQVNQRGQSEYVSNGYSLDMWYFRNYNQSNTKLVPASNGIRVTNNGNNEIAVYQYVYAETKQVVTLVAKVNGQTYSISGLPTSTGETPTIVVEEGKIELNVRYYDTDKRYRVYAMVGVNQIADIEYIDLFEGDIVYKHVKEDETTALMRSRRWFQYLSKIVFDCSVGYDNARNDKVTGSISFDSMVQEPTVSAKRVFIYATFASNTYESLISRFNIYGNNILFTVKRKDGSVLPIATDIGYRVDMSEVSISCEPL